MQIHIVTYLLGIFALEIAFSPSFGAHISGPQRTYTSSNIALVDHLNINHEIGRHDLVKAFYYDILGLAADPRKEVNVNKGSGGLWANAGITQFHFPEELQAQVFDGVVTLGYKKKESLVVIEEALKSAPDMLRTRKSFHWKGSTDKGNGELLVTDPWGSSFRLIADETSQDTRGSQPGSPSRLPCTIVDLCVNIPTNANLQGIGRFYSKMLGAPILPQNDDRSIQVVTSPWQTLTFKCIESDGTINRVINHAELRSPYSSNDFKSSARLANYGPHISMYVLDLPATYCRLEGINNIFVNERFKRKAYTKAEAMEQCMFRTLNIIDPDNLTAGPIIQLEHEIRSTVKLDGSGEKYKSSPFYEVPHNAVRSF